MFLWMMTVCLGLASQALAFLQPGYQYRQERVSPGAYGYQSMSSYTGPVIPTLDNPDNPVAIGVTAPTPSRYYYGARPRRPMYRNPFLPYVFDGDYGEMAAYRFYMNPKVFPYYMLSEGEAPIWSLMAAMNSGEQQQQQFNPFVMSAMLDGSM